MWVWAPTLLPSLPFASGWWLHLLPCSLVQDQIDNAGKAMTETLSLQSWFWVFLLPSFSFPPESPEPLHSPSRVMSEPHYDPGSQFSCELTKQALGRHPTPCPFCKESRALASYYKWRSPEKWAILPQIVTRGPQFLMRRTLVPWHPWMGRICSRLYKLRRPAVNLQLRRDLLPEPLSVKFTQ